RASAAPVPRQTDPAQARVPPGQAGEGNSDRPGTGRAPLLRMRYGIRWASNNSMQLTALRAAADAERYADRDQLHKISKALDLGSISTYARIARSGFHPPRRFDAFLCSSFR